MFPSPRPTAGHRVPYARPIGDLLVFLVALAGYTTLFHGILHGYQPWFDNLPLIVWSTPVGGPVDWAAWFTHGMTGYFDHHPGWPNPPSGFVRPGVNGLFWIDYQLFGRDWTGYLFANYVLNAVAVTLVYRVARGVLALPATAAVATAIVFAVCPATALSLLHPSYASDVLAGVCVVAGLLWMRADRALPAAAAFVLGVLTKETALVGPGAALLSALAAWRRSQAGIRQPRDPARRTIPARLVLCAVPLLIWTALRVAIRQSTAGAYPVETLRELYAGGGPARLVLHTLGFWPLGIGSARITAALGAVALPAFVVLNLLLLAGLGYRLIRSVGAACARVARDVPLLAAELEVSLWVLPWIPLFLLAPPEPRHAYGFYMLALPLLMRLVLRPRYVLVRVAAAGVLAALLLLGGRADWSLSRPQEVRSNFQRRYEAARELVALLGHADALGCETDYLAPNVVEYGSPDALQRFAGVRASVVNLTTVDGSFDRPWTLEGVGTRIETHGPATVIETTIPPEFHYIFQVPQFGPDRSMPREGGLVYRLTDARDPVHLGRTVSVAVNSMDSRACVLAYDFRAAHYALYPLTPVADRARSR